jgi:hypothetical protein
MKVLLVIKWQISWQEQDLNVCSQDLNQIVACQLELPKSGQGLDEQKSQKNNLTQTGTLLKLNRYQFRWVVDYLLDTVT